MPKGEEKLGKATIRWQPDGKGGFAGVVNIDGKRAALLEDEDEKRLIARLRNEAGKLHPDYVGFDGAFRRFKHFMPQGFASADNERSYKLKASQRQRDTISLEQALIAEPADARKLAAANITTNMLSPFEAARLRDTLLGPNGGAYLRGAATFSYGDFQAGATAMANAVKLHGRISWPLVTYLPFLWDYHTQMFLKPAVTADFSARVGLSYHHAYSADPNANTYRALLDLVGQTRAAIATLNPQDNIDIQSFIWVVGEYRPGDEQE